MPSADLYGACVTFLDGDGGDVRAAINAEQTGLMVAGSVGISRAHRGRVSAGRGRAGASTTAVIIPIAPAAARAIGPGFRLRDEVFLITITVRKKDLPPGKNLLATLRSVQRALVKRYDGMTNLAIPVTVGTATFRYAAADHGEIDETPESSEFATASVRAVFTFSEEQGINT